VNRLMYHTFTTAMNLYDQRATSLCQDSANSASQMTHASDYTEEWCPVKRILIRVIALPLCSMSAAKTNAVWG